MPTLTETIDNLYTTTWRNMKGSVADNILNATPLYFWMRQNGAFTTEEGGRSLGEPLRFAKNDTEFVKKGTSVALTDKEFLTTAIEDWRYLTTTIVRFGIDDQQNRGRNRILSLMQAKLDNAQDSLIDKMEETMPAAQSGLSFNGLQDLVADDPTTGTLHGIDASVETWWRNQTKDLSGISFGTSGVSEMNKMVNNCSNNLRQDMPDIIVTGQNPFELYWEETLEQKRIHNQTLGDAGFQNVEFRGIPMVWSPQVASSDIITTAGRMYFLNTKFLKFKYDPMMFFDMTEWKAIPDQINDRAAQVIIAGNLMTNRRKVQGVIHTIDTA